METWIRRKNLNGEIVKADRKNFKVTLDAKRLNTAIDKTVKALKAQCKRDKVTLYCEGMDENNMMVYKIKEVPSFVARIHHMELEF